jgi:regulator of sigma E protease
MSLLIFFIILSALIVVHELGHFLVARYFGIRVDEFGLGFPPRAAKLFTWMKTDFTLNWLPFGGFVKIFGENPEVPDASSLTNPTRKDLVEPRGLSSWGATPDYSFQSKNRGIQAAVLAAGVFFNFLFAWLLISIGFMTGIPSPAGLDLPLENPQTVITLVVPGSPADLAGLKAGDTILSLNRGNDILMSEEDSNISPQAASEFIASSLLPFTFTVERGGEVSEREVTPAENIIAERPAVGISMETIGTVRLPAHQAIWHGAKTTIDLTLLTATAIGSLISQAIVGKADLSAVTGPVGIVGMVGDMRELGMSYLITFTALLSINLSIINLLPVPALDGGRLLFVGVESVIRRQIPPRFFNAVNAAGFAFLIFLMILITIRDVRNIF